MTTGIPIIRERTINYEYKLCFDVQKQTITLKLHKKKNVLLFGFNFEPKLMSFKKTTIDVSLIKL